MRILGGGCLCPILRSPILSGSWNSFTPPIPPFANCLCWVTQPSKEGKFRWFFPFEQENELIVLRAEFATQVLILRSECVSCWCYSFQTMHKFQQINCAFFCKNISKCNLVLLKDGLFCSDHVASLFSTCLWPIVELLASS